jgi:hypothetical protein
MLKGGSIGVVKERRNGPKCSSSRYGSRARCIRGRHASEKHGFSFQCVQREGCERTLRR